MSCGSDNNNQCANSSNDCALCDSIKLVDVEGNNHHLLTGFKLSLASFVVFLFPLLSGVIAAITQETAVKKFVAVLVGFSLGSLIAILLSKFLKKENKK